MSSVVPEGWEKKELSFLTDLVSEKTEFHNQFEALTSSRSGLFRQSEYFNKRVTSADNTGYRIIAPGQFTFRAMSDDGTFKFNRSTYSFKGIVSPAYEVFEAKNCSPVFLDYVLNSDEFHQQIYANAQGGTRLALKYSSLSKLKVQFPSLLEQKKIASILTSVDEVIENTQKQIDKLQDLKKATMNELLTKGIGHTEFKDSELGRIPKSWEVGALSNLADFTSGFAFSSSDFSETGLLCIRMGNLYNNEFNPLRSPQYLPSEFASQHPRFVVTARDLLISMTGTAGKEDYGFVVEVPNEFNQGLLNQRVGKVIPKNQDAKAFIRELMRSRLYLEQLFSFGSGTKQANLSQSQIMGVSIPIPPIDEQRRIGETVSNVSDTINVLSRKLSQTQSLKKSLMQDLLTGKVRVTVN